MSRNLPSALDVLRLAVQCAARSIANGTPVELADPGLFEDALADYIDARIDARAEPRRRGEW